MTEIDYLASKESLHALFTLAGFTIEKVWQLPNLYMGQLDPLTDDQIGRDTPGSVGYLRTSDTGPTEGVVLNWMADYRWRFTRPGWLVKTEYGLIEIGWRKRVIHIDWSQTPVRVIVTPDNTTKSHNMVHAWSSADCLRYLSALAEQAKYVKT